MQNEWNGSQGYIALRKELTRGVVDPAGTPLYAPFYNENLITDPHLMSDQPAVGVNWRTYQALAGVRSHAGSLTVMCEPNTLAHWSNMTFKRKSSSGTDPATHTYDNTVFSKPDSYTLDISKGPQVIRYTGVESSKLGFGWDGEKMVLNVDVAALHAMNGREITSVSTTTLVLDQSYDQDVTTGFVAGDLVYVVKKDGSAKLSTTISSVTDNKTVVLGASAAAYSAGDMLVLRPATPMLSVLTPFTWPRTRFYFADTLSAVQALTSAQHTPMDVGTEITLNYEFEDKEGAKRSGSYDPASFPRIAPAADFKGKKIFDNAVDLKNWNAHRPGAAVMRAWTDNTDKYELRVTFPSVYTSALPIPQEPDKTTYQEPEFLVGYSQTAGYGFKMEILNALATV